MFEGSMFDVDKFLHTFIQSLGLRIKSPACKNFSKINFITYIDKAHRIEQQLLYTLDKVRDINMRQNLDFSNQENIRYFIEKHASFFDKFHSLSNTKILTSHLRNINTKILQKVRARRKSIESIKKMESKIPSKNLTRKRNPRTNLGNKLNESKKSLSSTTYREKHISLNSYKKSKCKKAALEACKLSCHDVCTLKSCKDADVLSVKDCNGKASGEPNLPSHITSIVEKEVEISKKILQLCTERIKCIKRNVEITLHIAKKECYNNGTKDQINYNEILCRHAILCLIEPSEKAFVLFEDSLSVVIQRYVSQGYKYHFEFQRDSQDCYTALLILSPWAKVFVKHIDTTMMRTICGILGCDVQKILVLHSPEENLS
ncbi:uncharacterized protein LOC143366138 [Andrena cerasifolii]|uniref:uncharacterized protein LOC143366138 n=1 Tax=Andrena cerasifolii TaxID=2819439 RepID=UPI0040378923